MKGRLYQFCLNHLWTALVVGLTLSTWILFYRADACVALYLISFTAWVLTFGLAHTPDVGRLKFAGSLHLAACVFIFGFVQRLSALGILIYGADRLVVAHLIACIAAFLFMMYKRMSKKSSQSSTMH